MEFRKKTDRENDAMQLDPSPRIDLTKFEYSYYFHMKKWWCVCDRSCGSREQDRMRQQHQRDQFNDR